MITTKRYATGCSGPESTHSLSTGATALQIRLCHSPPYDTARHNMLPW